MVEKKYLKIIYFLIPIIILFIVSFPLRFLNLGYHEFQDDEKKALIRLEEGQSTYEFFMKQRKGPLQWFVAQIPLLVTGDPRNETAQRLPFAIANLLAVLIFYLFVHKITKNKIASLFSALLFSVSGFVIGFSRISQYQSLNLLFSIASLYFYYDLVDSKKNFLKSGILGTVFFCLSALSHWDAVFILPAVIYFFVLFLKRSDIKKQEKKKFIISNIVVGGLILLPFLLPYVYNQINIEKNVNYFNTRVGLSDYTFEEHRFIFELYNPFYALWIYLGIIIVSVLFIKKYYWVFIWFLINILLIRLFMAKPGTHIYNYLIPVMVISGVTLSAGLNKINRHLLKVPIMVILFGLTAILYYQSYMLFVDHEQEYPWDGKTLFGKEIEKYYHKEVLTFGFPHFRNWKEVNNIVSADEDNCSYISNEGKEISQFYMDTKYGKVSNRKCYYVVVIKRPFISTRQNTNFAEVVGKSAVYKFKKGEETVTKVYKVRNKKYKK